MLCVLTLALPGTSWLGSNNLPLTSLSFPASNKSIYVRVTPRWEGKGNAKFQHSHGRMEKHPANANGVVPAEWVTESPYGAIFENWILQLWPRMWNLPLWLPLPPAPHQFPRLGGTCGSAVLRRNTAKEKQVCVQGNSPTQIKEGITFQAIWELKTQIKYNLKH